MTTRINAENLSPITHNQIAVITTELLAQVYGTEAIRIRQNHKRNDDRFIEGKHFFHLKGSDLKAFKDRVSQRYSVDSDRVTLSHSVAKHTRSLILWTERGAARHAKMLETDQAWEVFEKLEDHYFSTHKKSDLPAVGYGPLNIDILLAIRDDKVAFINQHRAGTLITVEEALTLLRARGWLVMPKEELARRLMDL
ncbi:MULTISPECIES: ORF6N domain-containing protein [Citrobacter]|uniref:ORF6N domain-containing protein n=1 Tax=Citrobacter TaxID=544 RepID=UPI0015EAFA22|nr:MULTISPECIES: ORF6N domain-containing protein [Citrobacter]MBA7873253.1 ORF6N domain-containing protein [Citrobacter sp. RHBSTW-00827]MBA7940976.1 ORF6N domain-containing protein [Citrobacter sp. RHBSTW-00509]MDT7054334.1 ORF6N domain-containing protein [Citrobacter freundii]QLS95104.1 ORF6N domain-containing protein [Citrobacter sp. RHBSTW-00859]QLT54486.1 ORF6N domain-containing protein [Citrobacter sp. RHBSTW-00821]